MYFETTIIEDIETQVHYEVNEEGELELIETLDGTGYDTSLLDSLSQDELDRLHQEAWQDFGAWLENEAVEAEYAMAEARALFAY